MARKGNPSPKVPSSAARLGSGGGKTTGTKIRGGHTVPVVPLDPANSGNADVVAQRAAQAGQGVMLSKQLRGNKSTGLKAGKR